MHKTSDTQETMTVFTITTLLLNVFIIVTLCAAAWAAHEFLSRPEPLGAMFLHGTWR
jgi:hypothetical protein